MGLSYIDHAFTHAMNTVFMCFTNTWGSDRIFLEFWCSLDTRVGVHITPAR